MKTTAVIMAGGRGERFWPMSRNDCPKQFLSLTADGRTMLQKTAERLLPITPYEDIFIVTNKIYNDIVTEQLPEIPRGNIICEPVGRNTAPCIALAAAVIQKKYGEAVIVILPSDHIIKNTEFFIDTLIKGIETAETAENLVTIGITPQYPETGYGYIKYKHDGVLKQGAFAVDKFVEKPDINKAREYVAAGNYLWNSGMFIWKASTILSNIKKFLPEYIPLLDEITGSINSGCFNEKIKEVFPKFKSESIDYAVMEKAENIYTIPGDFGWDDAGSWLALERINIPDNDGNYIKGNIVSENVKGSIFIGGKKLFALVGVEDIIVVDTDDVTLICAKNNTQDVKKIVEKLKTEELKNYL